MSGDPREPIYPTNVVYRPEFDGVIRRLETVEQDRTIVAVAAADIAYLKRTVRSMKTDLETLTDAANRSAGSQSSAREWKATGIALLGALVGVAGVVVAIVALASGGSP